MGIFDSTAEDMAAAGESGAQTNDGSPLSINVAGGKRAGFKNNVINLQTTETDYGAIESAFDLGEEIADVLGDGVGDLVDTVGDISSDNLDSMDLLTDALSNGVDEFTDALEFMSNNNNDLLLDLSRESADTAKEAMSIVEGMGENQIDFLYDVTESNNNLLTNISDDNKDLFRTLSANQAELTKNVISEVSTQSTDGLDAIANLAETKITDGQNMFIDLLKWVGVAVVLIVLVLGVVMAVIS